MYLNLILTSRGLLSQKLHNQLDLKGGPAKNLWKQTRRMGVMSLFLWGTFSADAEPRKVQHVVYVTHQDRAPLPGCQERIERIMEDIQEFYRDEMERNGYGRKTFSLERNKQGKMVMHGVKLGWDFDPEKKLSAKEILPEVAERLRKKNIDIEQEYIILFVNSYWKDGDEWKFDSPFTGGGSAEKGVTWVVDHEALDIKNIDPSLKERVNDRGGKLSVGQFNVKMLGGAAHELGHGLGLPHNSETKGEYRQYGKALMGAGNYTYRQERLGKRPHGSFLTSAHAFALSLHPLFTKRIPENFDVPDVFIEKFTVDFKGDELVVTGQVMPSADVAGVILYHDPLPTGTNKDYDAFSYLADLSMGGKFSSSMPRLPDAEGCGLNLRIYFKNGMYTKIRFTQDKENGLETIRNGYRWEQAKYAFQKKDADRLRKLIPQLEVTDSEAAERAKLFLRVAEQWEAFTTPALFPSKEKKVLLSSSRWNAARVGWYIPSFNGIMEPDGHRFRPLLSEKEECPDGLYAHAPSRYLYHLNGKWRKMKARLAIQRGQRKGSVVFVVKGDGKELYRSDLVHSDSGDEFLTVSVSGVKTLELITEDGADGTDGDWGIWIAPTLHR